MDLTLAEQLLLIQLDDEKGGDKEAKRRAEAIADGGFAGRAVADTVKDVQTAVMVATMASITATTAGAAAGN